MTINVLVTGAAGFIGSHVAHHLLSKGFKVTAVDYLKETITTNPFDTVRSMRLKRLHSDPKNMVVYDNCDLTNRSDVERMFSYTNFDFVVHLAGKTGNVESIKYPSQYASENLMAFANVIEFAARHKVRNFIYASSASVYGDCGSLPMREDADTTHPQTFYAATKCANELMAHGYSQNGLSTTGLRLFSIYGAYSNLAMAPYKFADAILNERKIQLYNHGQNIRDFTHISYVTHSIERLVYMDTYGNWFGSAHRPGHRIFNVGSGSAITTAEFVKELEAAAGKKADVELCDRRPGEVEAMSACLDLSNAYALLPYRIECPGRHKFLLELVHWVKLFQSLSQPIVPTTSLNVSYE